MTGQPPNDKTKKNVPAVMNGRLLLKALKQVVKGGLSFPGGHIPPSNHHIPTDFAGVGVASSDDPQVDDYLLARLQEAGINSVRVDISYADAKPNPEFTS